MLTHTIRALTLLGLLAIAHTIKPFSVANLTTFALGTANSLAQVLPENTLGKLERAGMLAALVTGNWNRDWTGESLLASRLTNQVVAATQFPQAKKPAVAIQRQAKQAAQMVISASLRGAFIARNAVGSSRSRHRFQGTPLPVIPGLELSLLPNTPLRLGRPMPLAAGVFSQTLPGKGIENIGTVETTEEPVALPKESTWASEETFFDPLSASFFRPKTIWTQTFSQQPVSGQACAQPVQTSSRLARTRNGKQSC